MKPIVDFIKAHILSMIALAIYSFCWCKWWYLNNEYQKYVESVNRQAGPSGGEAYIYGYLLLSLVGVLSAIALLILSFTKKPYKTYYLILSILFGLPVILIITGVLIM